MAYSDVTWDTSTNVHTTFNNGTVSGTSTGSNLWLGNCQSTTTIDTTTNIKVINVTMGSGVYWIAGLGHDPYDDESVTHENIEYAWHVTHPSNEWQVFELGTLKHTVSGSSPSDTAEIIRDGSSIKYYINGSLEYTSLTTTSATLYAQGSTYKASSFTIQYEQTGSGGGGSGGGSTPVNTDGSTFIEHILYLNTAVPR